MRRNSDLIHTILQNLRAALTIAENMQVGGRNRSISGHEARKMVMEVGDLIEVLFSPSGESTFRNHWNRPAANNQQSFQALLRVGRAYETMAEKTLHGPQTIEEGAEQMAMALNFALRFSDPNRTFALYT